MSEQFPPTPRQRIKDITFYNKLANRIVEKMYLPDTTEEGQAWLETQLAHCENTICEHLHEIAVKRLIEQGYYEKVFSDLESSD